MGRIGVYKPRQVVKAFERAGWVVKHQTGSHVIMEKEGSEETLSIPYHKGKTVKRGTLFDLIKDAGLTPQEFVELI